MGRLDGKIVFVPFALPGEVHKIRIVQEKKGFSRAESLEILEGESGGVLRREPFCPLYGTCGGCNMQHLSYEDQLKTKSALAYDSLKRLGGNGVVDSLSGEPEIVPSPEKAYRNRAQFHRRGDCLGFRSRNSHDLVPLESCPLLAGGINRFLGNHKIGSLPSLERFTLFGTEEEYWVEGVDRQIETELSGKRIRFSPELFFQSNLTLFPTLLDDVIRFAGEGERFLDLYSGVGVFSLFLEDHFKEGTAVESSRGALRFARGNLSKTDFYEEPVEKWVRKKSRKKLDFLVVDPPRTGLSRIARESVRALEPKRLCYVSCDPVTQSRDLKELVSGGFRLLDYRLYDFYPQTAHMEAVAFLERAE